MGSSGGGLGPHFTSQVLPLSFEVGEGAGDPQACEAGARPATTQRLGHRNHSQRLDQSFTEALTWKQKAQQCSLSRNWACPPLGTLSLVPRDISQKLPSRAHLLLKAPGRWRAPLIPAPGTGTPPDKAGRVQGPRQRGSAPGAALTAPTCQAPQPTQVPRAEVPQSRRPLGGPWLMTEEAGGTLGR